MAELLTELVRDVTATPREYAHALRGAFPTGLSGGPLLFQAEDRGVKLEIEISVGPERRIALMRLATLIVRIRFLSGDAEARQAVLRHMDLAMRRGGG